MRAGSRRSARPDPEARAFCGAIMKSLNRIEERLAEFSGTEAALLFGSGYAANIGLLQAIVSPDDLIVSDERNHASLIDGIRLTKARDRRLSAPGSRRPPVGVAEAPKRACHRHHRKRVQHGWRSDAASRRRGDCRAPRCCADRGRSARDRPLWLTRIGSRRGARACANGCWRRCTPEARRSVRAVPGWPDRSRCAT